MNDVSNYFGLLSCAAVAGMLVGYIFKTKRIRVLAAFTVAALTLVPTSSSGISLAARLFAFIDVPSVSLLTCMFILLVKPAVQMKKERPWEIVVVLMGALLYLSEFNVIRYDFYQWGYSLSFSAIVTLTAICLGTPLVITIAMIAFLLCFTGTCSNLFDALFDFAFWCVLSIDLIVNTTFIFVKDLKRTSKTLSFMFE